jgi:poly(A) polymerase
MLKLLAVEDPASTVKVMLDRNILRPVVPEIERPALAKLELLVEAERKARMKPDPLRRLASLLPRDPEVSGQIAARLKLSNKARKRLACAASEEIPAKVRELAYYNGAECAADRLLLAGEADLAAGISDWEAPRLPISGGMFIQRGLTQGPVVAKTLQAIERQWVARDFPQGAEFERIVDEALVSSRG